MKRLLAWLKKHFCKPVEAAPGVHEAWIKRVEKYAQEDKVE